MKKTVRLLSIPLVLFSFIFLACNGYGPYYGQMGRGHMYGYGMYGMGGGLFMGIIWIVFLLLLCYGVYYFIKNKNINTGANETPLEILKRRYAKGEITKEEYERIKSDLK
jgi:putative membrane protein